ncbi:MAG: winged helix DNA-binding domain-containing protein [Actinomycetales bacterium]
MTTLSRPELLRLRLANQSLTGPTATDPAGAVRSLMALQGQDLPGALYSVGLRMHTGGLSTVRAALNRGDIVRSWPMRGTLHLLAPDDLSLILPLTGARMIRGAAGRHRQLGITEADVQRCRGLALDALEDSPGLTRARLFTLFEAAGQTTGGQRGIHLLWLLCLHGWLVQGPLEGNNQLYVPYARWIGPMPERDPGEALAALALRYFRSHGPATERDFAWWSGLPLTQVRAAVAAVGDQLIEASYDSGTYLMAAGAAEALAAGAAGSRSLLALPGFDEFLLGYADRSAPLDGAHAQRVTPGNNGVFRSTIVYAGRVIGTWRKPSGTGAAIDPEPFSSLSVGQRAAFDRAAGHYRRFVET